MPTNIKKLLVPAAVVAFALFAFFSLDPGKAPSGTTGERTMPADGPKVPNAKLAFQDTHTDLIRVTAPEIGELIKSPLTVTGEARGPWYFEASFPVKLLDEDGTEIAAEPAQAQGEWMTEEFVPFSATLSFSAPKGKIGTVVLMKDNPSGDPSKDDSVSIPVRFVDVPVQW